MDPLYAIRLQPLRQQIGDRYRMLFFPVALGVFGALSWLWHHATGHPVNWGLTIGAGVGMSPSFWFGTPSRMRLAAPGDRARIDVWLAGRNYFRDLRGWVPKLPRGFYFNSQIVRYEDEYVIGPLVTLRKLRQLFAAVA